ncbi:MAG: hypothetical protein AB1814_12250 [Thermodesulfobacteriota bacterium]
MSAQRLLSSVRTGWLLLIICLLSWPLLCLPGAQAASQGFQEQYLCEHRAKALGGFTPIWVAYAQEEKKDPKTKLYYVELNGKRLGPFTLLSTYFPRSEDGRHIAFVAQEKGQWCVYIDGRKKWCHAALGWVRRSWTSSLDGNTVTMQTSSPIAAFSRDGDRFAYQAKLANKKWAVFINGKQGPEYKNVGVDIQFVDDTISYTAWTDKGIVKVFGRKVLGPYKDTWNNKYSTNGEYTCFMAQEEGQQVLVKNGKVVARKKEMGNFGLGPKGEMYYAYKEGGKFKLNFRDRDLPGTYDEIRYPEVSPDGKRIAFWARQGKTWHLVADDKRHPAWDGYYLYQAGSELYHIFWSTDAKNIAYYARQGDKPVLALNGQVVKPARGPHTFALAVIQGERGQIVGSGLMGPLLGDRQAFVQALLERDQSSCDPFTAVLLNGKVCGVVKKDKQSFMVVAGRQEGPYAEIKSPLMAAPGGKHYAYAVKTAQGAQMVINGKLRAPVYEAVYRPRFDSAKELSCLALKGGKLYRVRYAVNP